MDLYIATNSMDISCVTLVVCYNRKSGTLAVCGHNVRVTRHYYHVIVNSHPVGQLTNLSSLKTEQSGGNCHGDSQLLAKEN